MCLRSCRTAAWPAPREADGVEIDIAAPEELYPRAPQISRSSSRSATTRPSPGGAWQLDPRAGVVGVLADLPDRHRGRMKDDPVRHRNARDLLDDRLDRLRLVGESSHEQVGVARRAADVEDGEQHASLEHETLRERRLRQPRENRSWT